MSALHLGTEARESLDMDARRTWLGMPYGVEHVLDRGLNWRSVVNTPLRIGQTLSMK
jgi:hypothetical protein